MRIDLSEKSIGTIFTSIRDNTPNVDQFTFILDENTPKLSSRQGLFVFTISEDGLIVGKIETITVKNEYYEKPQTVKNMDSGSLSGLRKYFPSDQWEDFIGIVRVLGTFPFEGKSNINSKLLHFSDDLRRSSFPAKPGGKVYILMEEKLEKFIGLDKTGLYLGTLEHYNLDVKLNLNRLINRHFAILAISGAGKSYLVSDLIEEMLLRDRNKGTPGILLIDPHGEYKFLSDNSVPENKTFALKTNYYDAKYLEIDTSTLSAYDFAKYQPNISNAQIRELKKVLETLKKRSNETNDSFDILDIIDYLENIEQINMKVRDALVGWLFDLKRLRLFSKNQNPQLKQMIQPGKLTILDLSSLISMRKKQIIVSYIAERLFYKRRNGQISPYLMIIEEAHQFAPEGVIGDAAISKRIIETIAREGRKFYAQIGLISQRPVKLSTTALSQCNTHIILRVTNPSDLEHIKASSEALTTESLKMISTLPTGNALVMGAATNMPVFIRVRRRYSSNPHGEESLEEACMKFTG